MSLDPALTPVIVAVGQSISRDRSAGALDLAELAAAQALGAAPRLAAAIDTVLVVKMLSDRAGLRPASDLAARLGLAPATVATTTVGGDTPQRLVTRAAAEISAGLSSATMIVGGESLRTGRLRSGGSPQQSVPALCGDRGPDPVLGEARRDLTEEERAAGLYIPLFVYPLFESVLASRANRDPVAQRAHLGRVLEPLTAVAAAREYAWFPQVKTPEMLATPTEDNRLVVEPYTKTMVAFLGAAQGAAVVVTSLAVARRIGLAEEAVFVWSGASCDEVWYPIARSDLGRSEGAEVAGRAALHAGGVGIDDVELLDVYSCFPSALQLGAAALGVAPDDPRSLTVTGGLPYFGGPGNNYATHAIAELVRGLRLCGSGDATRARLGMVTAVGWYLTKHAVGLYGTEPPSNGFRVAETRPDQERIDAGALPFVSLSESISLEARVDASTVVYDRRGVPAGAPVVATLSDGRRIAAAAQLDELPSLAGKWLVGAQIAVEQVAGKAAASYRVLSAEL